MAIDYSKLTDQELEAIASGDLSKVSDKVLMEIEAASTEEERGARRVQTPSSAFSSVRPEISGATFQPPAETLARGAAPALRYGAPIAAGMATGGIGLAPAVVTGLTGLVGEAGAEFAEKLAGLRSEMSGSDIGAAGIAAASPIFKFKGASNAAEELISPAVKSFLATLGGQLGTSEVSRVVQTGELKGLESETSLGKATEAVARWGAPVLVSGVSSLMPGLDKAAEDIAALKAEGRRPILMDVLPDMAPLEAKNFKAGNRLAVSLVKDMDADMATVLKTAYGDMSPQSQSEIAQMLSPYVGALDEARSLASQARQASAQADEALKVAEFKRTGDLATIKRAAEEAGLQQILADQNLSTVTARIFGNEPFIKTSDVALGSLQNRVKKLATAAADGVDSGLDALYANAGIRPNDPVVSKTDVLRSIQARTAQGRALEANESADDARKAVEAFFGDKDTASLSNFRKFRDTIARNLPEGTEASTIERYASSLYDALKQSSYRFIERNYGEDTIAAFRQAQNRASANFTTRTGGAVEMLKEGKFKDFYNAIKQEGPLGNMMTELNAYSNSLARLLESAKRSGQVWRASDIEAINIARNFKQDVNNVILHGIIDESILNREAGMNLASAVIDPQKLIKTLGYFESNGFNLKQLGIDNTEISKLIKANAKVGKEPLTVGQLNEFMELLPSNGGDLAANRLAYRKIVADGMIEAGAKEKSQAFLKAKRFADSAKLDEATRQAEYRMALADPITQFFAENGTMLLGKGALQNSDWVDTIIKKDSDTVGRFVDSLRNPARGVPREDILNKLKEAAVAYTVKRFIPNPTKGMERLDAEQIVAPFISQNREMQMMRQNLKKILGDAEYEKMTGLIVEPLRKVLVNRVNLGQDVYSYASDLKGLISAQALMAGKPTAGTLLSNATINTANLAEKGQYAVLASIYLNPQYASQLAKVGYDLNRFRQLSDRNRMAVDALMMKDAEDQQSDLQNQFLTQGQPTR
jgi:hypothetical protein